MAAFSQRLSGAAVCRALVGVFVPGELRDDFRRYLFSDRSLPEDPSNHAASVERGKQDVTRADRGVATAIGVLQRVLGDDLACLVGEDPVA